MKVSELVVRSLEAYGTKRVYGLIGTSILELVDALKDSSIRYISTRHEQVAVSMADAEGRVTGRPGVAFVHGGPGFLNSLVSLANAHKDGSPLLLVAGAVKRRMVGMDSWLEVPQSDMARYMAKAALRVERGADAPRLISEAFSAAASDPKGPALLEVPEDVWTQDAGSVVRSPTAAPAANASKEDVEMVRVALASARRPLLVAGGGLNSTRGSSALASLLRKVQVPVVVTGNGRGAISEDDRLCLGRIGFGGGNRVADNALQDADLVVCLGCGLSDVSTYGFNVKPRGSVYSVNLDPLWDKKPVPYAFHVACDASSFAEELARGPVGADVEGDWLAGIERGRASWSALLREELSRRKPGFVNAALFMTELDAALPGDRILAAGQGLHIVYAYLFMKVRSPASFLAATNMGSMGFVFPAALGAKVSRQEKDVLAVMGDGEFMMTVHDLETAVRERIGVKIVVVNDGSYRVLLMRQKLQKMGRVFGTLHTNPDIVKLADAFGAEAMSVNGENQIARAVEFLKPRTELPRIVELRIDPEDLPPLNLEGSMMF